MASNPNESMTTPSTSSATEPVPDREPAGPLEGSGKSNRVNERGDTPLHEAVRGNQARLAASLLANGADWSVSNADGQLALSPEFATLPVLHRIRQEYQRLPDAIYDHGRPVCAGLETELEQLERDGVARVSGFFESEQLTQMQADFQWFVRKVAMANILRRKRFVRYDQQEYWHPKHRSYVTNDALRHSPRLAALCCRPAIVSLANHYLRKPAHVKRTYGMRYLPSGEMSKQQFRWHHDMEDRQLKIMVLLTDVGETDQYMTYVRGSHNTFHPVERFHTNLLDFDYCRTYLEDIDIVKLTGSAGDLFLFDSNGMHRGNRTNGRVRDAFFVEFTADRNRSNLWGTAAPRRTLPQGCGEPGQPLHELLSVRPKWERVRNQPGRKQSSWMKSLDDPSKWL